MTGGDNSGASSTGCRLPCKRTVGRAPAVRCRSEAPKVTTVASKAFRSRPAILVVVSVTGRACWTSGELRSISVAAIGAEGGGTAAGGANNAATPDVSLGASVVSDDAEGQGSEASSGTAADSWTSTDGVKPDTSDEVQVGLVNGSSVKEPESCGASGTGWIPGSGKKPLLSTEKPLSYLPGPAWFRTSHRPVGRAP